MAEPDADLRNPGCDDNKKGSDNCNVGIDRNDEPLHPVRVSIIDGKPAAKTSQEKKVLTLVADNVCNYWTISRWTHRVSEWKKYKANTSKPKKLPDPKTFLYSINGNATGDTNTVEQLIWGTDKDSLETTQAGLAALEIEHDKCQFELSCLQRIISLDEEESNPFEIPADSNMFCEILEFVAFVRGIKEQHGNGTKEMEEVIKLANQWINRNQALIEKTKARIKFKQDLINLLERRAKADLCSLWDRHESKWHELSILCHLAACRNETTGSDSTVFWDEKRIDMNPRYYAHPTLAEKICDESPDTNFLTELLEKKEIICNQEHLIELQTFVATLVEKANTSTNKKDVADKNMEAFVDAILHWKPGTTVESLVLGGEYPCRPSQGCDTSANQPILWALIVRMLALLGQTSTSICGEKVVAPVGAEGQGCPIDFIGDEYRKYVHIVVPETQNDRKVFQENHRKAREQVIKHLVEQLRFAFNFGGVGQDCRACRVVLSMFYVQVLEMHLTRMGTREVHVTIRQTAKVPLLGGRLIPKAVHGAVGWDMGSNGVLLFASAMLDMTRKSLFDKDNQQATIVDVSAAEYYSSHSQDPEQQVNIEIQSLLGSGSYSHVVKVGEERFMKIPRQGGIVKSLMWECEILGKLELSEKPWFPRIMPWGISVVNLFIRNEISQIKVLPLTGIVGCSLSCYCKYKRSERSKDVRHVHLVIREVYDALEYAHSKGIFHMDVQPGNIIVKWKNDGFDVLLTDWGCSMLSSEELKDGQFVGCRPYAHDDLLGERDGTALAPKAAFDFASLGFTWYDVVRGGLDWQFDRWVSAKKLKDRRTKMNKFFNGDMDYDTACLVPKVREIFVQPDNQTGSSSKK